VVADGGFGDGAGALDSLLDHAGLVELVGRGKWRGKMDDVVAIPGCFIPRLIFEKIGLN
jgi:hypothetical protein